ncbi:MAG: hypothetical protein GY820_24440 [Gammaproteobacteria bacterium]|nr:hypothetical protein [Gammaproteobacteria bacterium]
MIKIGSRSAEHGTNETPTTKAPKHHSPVDLTNTFPAAVGSVFLELQSVNCKEISPELVPWMEVQKFGPIGQLSLIQEAADS